MTINHYSNFQHTELYGVFSCFRMSLRFFLQPVTSERLILFGVVILRISILEEICPGINRNL